MTNKLKLKTHEGYTIKVLAELLQNNIQTACLEITPDGIKLNMTDFYKKILILLELKSENFNIYRFTEEKLFIGINLNHLYKMLKSVKKKDAIELFIEKEFPDDLGIKIIPKDKHRITTSKIKIQSIQNLEIEVPDGYTNPIIIPSNEYQKMTKDLVNIGSIITVDANMYNIKFSCTTGNVYSREVFFGEDNMDQEFQDDIIIKKYIEDFDTEQLTRISKMSGLSSILQIYTQENFPLLFKTSVGTLGQLSIYIKSKKQIEDENNIDNVTIIPV